MLVVVTSLAYTAATYLIIVILLGARLPAGVLAQESCASGRARG